MRVKDFILLYSGMNRVEVTGFEIVNSKLRLMIRGCE